MPASEFCAEPVASLSFMRAARQRPNHLQVRAAAPDAAPGLRAFALEPYRAMVWRQPMAGVLQVAGGRLWITFDQPHAAGDGSDHFVAAGEVIELRAGERALLEPVRDDAGALVTAVFDWQPLPAHRRAAVRVQALADLRQALALAAGACGRLLFGTPDALSNR